MAAEQGIEMADDGVAEVSMTKARASLTALIREVAWGRKVGAFKERGERAAYLVTPDFYRQALEDRRRIAALDEGTVKQRAARLASMVKNLDELD